MWNELRKHWRNRICHPSDAIDRLRLKYLYVVHPAQRKSQPNPKPRRYHKIFKTQNRVNNMTTNSKTTAAKQMIWSSILAVLTIMCAKIVQLIFEFITILAEITDSHNWESLTTMKFSVTILKIGLFLAAQNEGKFNPSKLLRKIRKKSYLHLAQKGAKSLLTASLFSGIGQVNYGHSWSFYYFDKKFGTISTTFPEKFNVTSGWNQNIAIFAQIINFVYDYTIV